MQPANAGYGPVAHFVGYATSERHAQSSNSTLLMQRSIRAPSRPNSESHRTRGPQHFPHLTPTSPWPSRFAPSARGGVGDGFAPSPPPPLGARCRQRAPAPSCSASARSPPSRRSVAQGSHAKRCYAGWEGVTSRVTLQPYIEHGSELKEGRAGGAARRRAAPRNRRGFQRAGGLRAPFATARTDRKAECPRPAGRSGLSPLTFPIIASGDRQLAADTGGCPAPSARRPEPEPQGADTLQAVGRPAGGRLRAKPSENRPTEAGHSRRRGVAENSPHIPCL